MSNKLLVFTSNINVSTSSLISLSVNPVSPKLDTRSRSKKAFFSLIPKKISKIKKEIVLYNGYDVLNLTRLLFAHVAHNCLLPPTE